MATSNNAAYFMPGKKIPLIVIQYNNVYVIIIHVCEDCDGVGGDLNLVRLLVLMMFMVANVIMMEGGRHYDDDDSADDANAIDSCSCW